MPQAARHTTHATRHTTHVKHMTAPCEQDDEVCGTRGSDKHEESGGSRGLAREDERGHRYMRAEISAMMSMAVCVVSWSDCGYLSNCMHPVAPRCGHEHDCAYGRTSPPLCQCHTAMTSRIVSKTDDANKRWGWRSREDEWRRA